MKVHRPGCRLALGVALWLGAAGCATRTAEESAERKQEYVPFAERPKGAAAYWALRDLEDRIESEIERRNAPR